jgi:ribonuclease VapC
VFDASALLAYLGGEEGAATVEEALEAGGACSAANWSEIAQTLRGRGRNWDLARSLLTSFDLEVEPVTVADAEWAASRWRRDEGLSPADRFCLALAARLEADAVWTADAVWGTAAPIRQIR